MKTNQFLSSPDRDLFGTIIRQQSKTQFLCVTDLQKAYDFARFKNNWTNKRIDHVTKSKDFKERVFYVLKKLNLITPLFGGFIEMVEREGVTKVLKGLNVWQTKGRGQNRAVYCNPYIWVMIALELNPMLYAEAIMWLADTLIINRIFAGDQYKPMNAAIKSILDKPNYPIYAKAINKKVFGFHKTGIRNECSSEDLQRIGQIERFVKDSIKAGFVKTEKEITQAIKNYSF